MPESGAQQVSNDDQVVVGGVAFGTRLDGLGLRVHGLHSGVAQAAAELLEDAGLELAHGGAQAFEGEQAGCVGPS